MRPKFAKNPLRAESVGHRVEMLPVFVAALQAFGNLCHRLPGPPLAMLVQAQAVTLRAFSPSSLLKKPPGGGTGPTMQLDFQENPVGRVPSHGVRDVFQRAAKA